MSTRDGVGLAILVKTPGHSPVKTRLAATIGAQAACDFHIRSAHAVAAVARAACRRQPQLTAYWAVAEPAALDHPCWSSLPHIEQGVGDLGARMRHVADLLCARHGGAVLLGADTPQIEPGDLHAAVDALAGHPHVLAPSADGGFWLLASRGRVPARAWTHTPWSRADTCAQFAMALGDVPVARMRVLRDVDGADDLPPLLVALDALREPLPEQAQLARWLRDLLPSAGQKAPAAAR